jgi:hypothetical protein
VNTETMTEPAWDQAKAAMAAGDTEQAAALIDAAVRRWRYLQDYSISWVTSLLSFVGRELGEDGVERALRAFGEEYVRPRRSPEWDDLSAEARATNIVRSMVANFGTCEVEEDDEKITLSFRCGTGGRLIDEGRYEGDDAFLVLRERGGRTFMRDELPVYCAHCSINNEIQPVEWGRPPTTVEHPPAGPGEPCVHHVYKDTSAMPTEVFERIDCPPPSGH